MRRIRAGSLWLALAASMCLALIGLVGASTSFAPAAGAASHNRFPIRTTVDATTTIAKLNQTVKVPQGTFSGWFNTNNGRLKGTLKLPPASTTVSLAGLGLAQATFSLAPTKGVAGKVNLRTFVVVATSTFNILVTSVDPVGTSLNLVGPHCRTSTPISLTFSGQISPLGSSTVSGSYTIPSFEDCHLAAPVLSAAISGPGNTFTATMTPANS